MSAEVNTSGPGLIASMWRYRWWLVLAAALCGVLGFVLSSLQSTTFEAEAVIILRDPNDARLFSDAGTYSDPERYVSQQASLAQSTPIMTAAADIVGGVSVTEFSEAVDVTPEVDLNRLSIMATAESPERAAAWANATTEAFQSVVREQRMDAVSRGNSIIEDEIADLRSRIDELSRQVEADPTDTLAAERLRSTEDQLLTLQTRLSELSADAAMFGAGVQLIEQAQPPQSPVTPEPLRDAVLAAILAMMVGAAVAYWRAGQTPRTEGRSDPGVTLNAPLLGEVPTFERLESELGGLMPGTAASEAFRFVLSSIEFSLEESGGSSIMITSAEAGAGKTATALHLAVAAARTDRSVLLVDADVRRHGLTSKLRAQDHEGLVEFANNDTALGAVVRRFRLSDDASLSVVPAGRDTEQSIGLMRTPRFKQAMRTIREHASFVIVDSPPILALADAAELASQVDAIVLVVSSQAELDQLERVRRRLAFVPTPLIGYVYNQGPIDRAGADRSRPPVRLPIWCAH